MISAREAALLALYDIFFNGTYSNLAVKDTLKKCKGMGKTDKALFTNLVYGVVSRHYTLEYIIKKYSSVKPKKLARYVKLLLELGIYQISFMDRIPESAAVNESVKLAKKYCKKGSERFVNGVLRAYCNDGCKMEYPEDKTEYLSVKYSFSMEMTKEFLNLFGYEFSENLMESLNEAPPLTLRPNIIKCSVKELAEKLNSMGIVANADEGGMVCTDGFDVASNELYIKGYFTVQDKSAYNVARILNPSQGETVIDMCAAPGGKTTHIAELMNDCGQIIAWDIHKHKIDLINNNANRLGLKSINAQVWDSTQFNPKFANTADKVLCDVPCSGWGIIRRKPDIKLSHTDISEIYDIQYSILKNASEYVKYGGCIVYSTCTVNRCENEEIIKKFLSENKDYDKTYEKTFYPNTDNSDGFFICRLDRKR